MSDNDSPMQNKHWKLLTKICEPMTLPGRVATFYIFNIPLDGTEGLDEKWIAFHLWHYKEKLISEPNNIKKTLKVRILKEALEKHGLSGNFIERIKSETSISTDKSRLVFKALAEAESCKIEKTVDFDVEEFHKAEPVDDYGVMLFMLKFFKYCEEKSFPLIIFDEKIKSPKFKKDNPKYTKLDLKQKISDIEKDIQEWEEKVSGINKQAITEPLQEFKGEKWLKNRFQEKIDYLTKDYFKRDYISDEIDTFLKEKNKGHIAIRGEAGAGKSSALADTVKKYQNLKAFDCVWHFVTHGDKSTDATISFLTEIYRQLRFLNKYELSFLEGEYKELRQLDSQAYSQFLNELLQTISANICNKKLPPLIIFIDALDEISKEDSCRASRKLNFFYIPQELPENIYFVVSCRNDMHQTYKNPDPKIILLHEDEEHQKDAVKGYIRRELKCNKGLSEWMNVQEWPKKTSYEKQLVELFCTKSEYRFVYLHHVFKEIEKDIHAYHAGNLPKGLEEYYERQYLRLLDKEERGIYYSQLILYALCIFNPDISYNRLLAYCDLKPKKFNRLTRDWFDIRLVRDFEEDGFSYIKFSHLSFKEFIDGKMKKLTSIKNNQSLYKHLLKSLCQDFQVDEQTKNLVYNEAFSTKMKEETFELFFKSLKHVSEIDDLANCLAIRAFVAEAVSLEKTQKLIACFFDVFDNFESRNRTEKAMELADRFFSQIVWNENPIITQTDFEYLGTGDFKRSAMTYYTNQKTKSGRRKNVESMRDKILSKHYSDGNDIELLTHISVDELIEYAGTIRARYRERRYLGAAHRENNRILEVYYDLIGSEEKITNRLIEQLEYEQSYVDFFLGNYAQSSDSLRKSIKNAKLANSLVGIEVSEFRIVHNSLFDGTISYDDARTEMEKRLQNLLDLRQRNFEPAGFRDGFIFNINGRLFELAVEVGDIEEAELRYEEFVNAERATPLTTHSRLGQLRFIQGRYDEALENFAVILAPADLSEFAEDTESLPYDALEQELACVYLYAGKCLLKKGLNDKATEVFNLGLNLIPECANHYWQDKIHAELPD